jgi:2-methylisocitrate lyase-like PEP mutase family enzyme
MTTPSDRRQHFRSLHASGTFIIPNPYDVGTAKLLAALGFQALASTSQGFAATLGRLDMQTTRDELVAHISALAAATDLPLNVDAERCFAETAVGVSETVQLLADAGAAGVSIEDWNPVTDAIDPIDVAGSRVAAAASTAAANGVMLTARCENHLHGIDDLNDTIARLCAYRDAGAEAVYAPLLPGLDAIRRVVDEVGLPVNALLTPGGPTIAQLADVGVRRVSVGSLLSKVALGAFVDAARSLLDIGQLPTDVRLLSRDLSLQAFG